MSVRIATLADAPRLVELGVAMHAESRFARFPLDRAKGEAFFRRVLVNPSVIAFVAGAPVCGMFIGFCQAFWWGEALESSELLLYVAPEERRGLHAVHLVQAYVQEAQRRGVVDIKLCPSTGGLQQERIARFFEGLGFERIGFNCALKG